MLTFLNPGLLVGLVAAAIPILIHLFTRRKVKTVPFSTVRFIKELQRRKIRYLKLRQILLLVLRTLAVLFLALAFARPALKQTRGVLSGAALSAVAIILDNTLSMGVEVEGRSRLASARELAERVLDLLKDGDDIWLIHPQRPPRVVTGEPIHGIDFVREQVRDTELSAAATDLSGAIAEAVERLSTSRHLNKEIYLISDLQRSGFTAEAAADSVQVPEDVKLFVLPVSRGGRANLMLDSVAVVNQIVERGRVTEVAATIRNTGAVRQDDRLVHLYIGGKRVGQATVSLEPGTATRVVFRIVPDRTGTTTGYAQLEDDDLLQDNRRYFAFHIPEEIRVLLAGEKADDTRYLRLALRPDESTTTYMRVRQIRPAELNRLALSKADVVILENLPSIDDVTALGLREFVRQGGGLVIFLGSSVDIRSYNENLFPRLEMPALTQAIGRLGSAEAFLTFGNIDYEHPIFHGVFEGKERAIESPHVNFAFDVARDSPHDVIIAYSTGTPFLVEGGVGVGRVLMVTTSTEESWSDLATRGIFAPLVNRMVTYLAGRGTSRPRFLTVGSELVFQPKIAGENLEFAVQRPDEEILQVKPEVAEGLYTIRVSSTDRTGFYRVMAGDRELAVFAVNPSPQESDLRALKPDEVRSLTGAQLFQVIGDVASLADLVRRSRYGRELWEGFVTLALLCLLVEMLLFRSRGEAGETDRARRSRRSPVETLPAS